MDAVVEPHHYVDQQREDKQRDREDENQEHVVERVDALGNWGRRVLKAELPRVWLIGERRAAPQRRRQHAHSEHPFRPHPYLPRRQPAAKPGAGKGRDRRTAA